MSNEDTVNISDKANEATEPEEAAEEETAEKTEEETTEEQEEAEPEKTAEELLIEEVESLKDELLRSKAEQENTRKRLTKQRQEDVKYAPITLVRDILPVLDNLELALQHAEENDPLAQGVAYVLDGFKKALEQNKVLPIKSTGEVFNPAEHDAICTEHDPKKKDGVVIEEKRTGYRLHERVVRAAGVVVNRYEEEKQKEPAAEKEEPERTEEEEEKQ